MTFFTFIIRNLSRRPARSLLTVVGLSVAVAALVALVGVATGFERSFIDMYRQRGIDLVVQRAGGGEERLNNGLPVQLNEKIMAVPGVKQSLAGLLDAIAFEGSPSILVNGWEPGSALFDRVTTLSGRKLQPGETKKCMLGRVLADNVGKKVGDTVEVYTEPFEIVGIYESTVVFENGAVLVPLAELQRLMHRPNEVTGFTVVSNFSGDADQIEDLRKRIEAIGPDIAASLPADLVRSVSQIKLARSVAWLTSVIAIIIGAIGMLNTMIMAVFERTREIGTLRAIGWKKARVVRMVLGEAVLLSVAGGLLGCLGGVLLAKFLSTLPKAAGIVQGNVAPNVIAEGFLVALIVGVGGAIYPALWSANLLPTEALRRK